MRRHPEANAGQAAGEHRVRLADLFDAEVHPHNGRFRPLQQPVRRDVLADPVVEDILAAAGFAEVDFTDVHEPVHYGPDGATAYDFVLGLRDTRELLAGLDAATAEQALRRLRATLAAHDTGGVFFDSRSWIITATLPGRAG
jgi:hypothetical protein